MTDLEACEERIERLEAALHRIRQRCDAYPVETFPGPDVDALRRQLGDGPFSALHASWARHILAGVRRIVAEA